MKVNFKNCTFEEYSALHPDHIEYRGVRYPCISVDFVTDEGHEENHLIASESLQDALRHNGELFGSLDEEISYYCFNGQMVYEALEDIVGDEKCVFDENALN